MKTLYFSEIFLLWYYSNRRDLPWRYSSDAYNNWIAEVIFQQTRINQGIEYYRRFIERFPSVESLANASEEEVLKMWQGLGYYTRARNIHITAKQIANELNGNFPSTYTEIKKLKGIGDYTAAAIASIVFNEPVPAIDGNVFRVLSRLFAIDLPVDTPEGRKYFRQIAENLIDHEHPGDFNQAVMEFGALQCIPRNPNCAVCPFKSDCLAYIRESIELYPKKIKTTTISVRYFNYIIIDRGQSIYFKKRTEKDIWKNLYDFPMVEGKQRIIPEDFLKSKQFKEILNNHPYSLINISEEFTHQLSHQKIIARFYYLSIDNEITLNEPILSINKEDIFTLPVPKIIETILNTYSLYLR
jgi:A/G-specific adenine glycosylase